jgi:hypothetical protein
MLRKHLLLLSALVLCTIGLFTACKKSSSSPSSSFSATMNGTTISGVSQFNLSDTLFALIGAKSLSGTSPSYPYFSFNINNFKGKGTYNLDSTLNVSLAVDSTTTNIIYGVYGSVVITASSSSSVSGTFSFTCADSTKITSGAFTATVQ